MISMIKNKKGFTLVELLAVLLVLVIIVLIAVNVINSRVKEAKKNAVEVNANNYIKAVNGVAALSQNIGEDMEKGTFEVRELNKKDIKISGEKPRRGFLVLSNYDVTYGCLMYDTYSAVIVDGKTASIIKGNCKEEMFAANYDYTGSEQVFTANVDGWYKLEVWGAQGGDAYNMTGGYGGYSVGLIKLSANDKLYINVGGKGNNRNANGTEVVSGNGYNGGGTSTQQANTYVGGGGGGATSIATSSGLLKNLSSHPENVIIVAGGGGGASYGPNEYTSGIGGHAGGYIAKAGENNGSRPVGYGGTQTAGGTSSTSNTHVTESGFGKGCEGLSSYASYTQISGGGGYYGGGCGEHAGGGGGSGFIGNNKLSTASMYCYGCATSNLSTTKTISTLCAEENPTSQCAKKGNGFVKVSYSTDMDPTNNVTEYAFTNGEQVLHITKTGTYKLETWGAQGGSVNSTYYGGYGSYSVGEIRLTKGQILYINVGGQGSSSMKDRLPGGYNGGGSAHGADCDTNTNRYGSSGGGATSIATVSGQLSTLEKYKGKLNNNGTSSDTSDDYYESDKILIVAGGGGGAVSINNWYTGSGGAAGGILGTRGFHNHAEHPDYTYGGTQTSGGRGGSNWKAYDNQTDTFKKSSMGSFGQGGTQGNIVCNEGGSGGGGFYGGGAGSQTSGGGGSGYIANPSLTNKKMVVYSSSDAYVSSTIQTKTERTTSAYANPTSNYPKLGDGYAIITLIN